MARVDPHDALYRRIHNYISMGCADQRICWYCGKAGTDDGGYKLFPAPPERVFVHFRCAREHGDEVYIAKISMDGNFFGNPRG